MKTVVVPPIKSQGIKTKLVRWIYDNSRTIDFDRWVEPFMGTGVVAFNIKPHKALLCDSNPHIINFYKALQNKEITPSIVKAFLTQEGSLLLQSKGEHYYTIRERFNNYAHPLDFLFLSRACFNGMMRFNKNGKFNVPFCRKNNRFSQALVTKITNQVKNISEIIACGDYTFINQDFKDTLSISNSNDFIYADPPYIGRHTDYFDSWSEQDEIALNNGLMNSNAKFILSTWLSNKYRTNEYIFSIWNDCHISTKEHFYYIGAKEDNRNAIFEALLSNFAFNDSISNAVMKKRIENNESPLTSFLKPYPVSVQMNLLFEEPACK